MSMEEMLAEMKRESKGFARGSSEYRGVSWRANTKHWEARIGRLLGRKYTYLGTYQTAEEAARAYDRAVISIDGRAAITNFPKSDYEERIKEVENSTESEKLQMQMAIANRTHEWTVKGIVTRSRPTVRRDTGIHPHTHIHTRTRRMRIDEKEKRENQRRRHSKESTTTCVMHV